MSEQKSIKPAQPAVRVAREQKTLMKKIPYFIGCNTSDALPPDTSQRCKHMLREAALRKYASAI